jgi:hypothetical protein
MSLVPTLRRSASPMGKPCGLPIGPGPRPAEIIRPHWTGMDRLKPTSVASRRAESPDGRTCQSLPQTFRLRRSSSLGRRRPSPEHHSVRLRAPPPPPCRTDVTSRHGAEYEQNTRGKGSGDKFGGRNMIRDGHRRVNAGSSRVVLHGRCIPTSPPLHVIPAKAGTKVTYPPGIVEFLGGSEPLLRRDLGARLRGHDVAK